MSFPPRSVTAAAHVGGGPVLPNDEKVILVVFANPPPPRGSASVVEGWPQTGPERSGAGHKETRSVIATKGGRPVTKRLYALETFCVAGKPATTAQSL